MDSCLVLRSDVTVLSSLGIIQLSVTPSSVTGSELISVFKGAPTGSVWWILFYITVTHKKLGPTGSSRTRQNPVRMTRFRQALTVTLTRRVVVLSVPRMAT